jgi:hypothetical protein
MAKMRKLRSKWSEITPVVKPKKLCLSDLEGYIGKLDVNYPLHAYVVVDPVDKSSFTTTDFSQENEMMVRREGHTKEFVRSGVYNHCKWNEELADVTADRFIEKTTALDPTEASIKKMWDAYPLSSGIYGVCVLNLEQLKNNRIVKLFPASSLLNHVHPLMHGFHTSYLYYGRRETYFNLHSEDVDTFSINVHHRGAGKVWYGICRKDNEKLKVLIKSKLMIV